MPRVVVDGLLDRRALEQRLDVRAQQFAVERVGMVEVPEVSIGDRDVVEVAVVRVLVEDGDA